MKLNVLFFILLCSIPVWAQAQGSDSLKAQIQLKTSIEATEVPVNREVVYHIDLSWLGELDRYRIVDVGEPAVSNLQLQSSGSSNKIFTAADGKIHSIKRISFSFKPVSIGMAYIDGVSIQYEDTRNGQKGSLMAQRLGVKITDPVEEPGQSNMGRNILIAAAVLFLLVVLFSVYRYSKQKKQAAAEHQQEKTTEEKYLERLRDEIDSSAESEAGNIVRLSKLLNDYLMIKWNFDLTLAEPDLKERLQGAGISEEMTRKLIEFNKKAELNKFAGEEMNPAEFHLFYDTVEQLLSAMNTRTQTASAE